MITIHYFLKLKFKLKVNKELMPSTIKNYFFSLNKLSGKVFELFFLLITLIFCFLSVVETYYPQNQILAILDKILLSIVICEYFLRVLAESKKLRFIFLNFYSLIDLITIISSLLIYFSPITFDLGFIRIFYLLKPLRIVRFARYLQSEEFFFGRITNYHLKIVRLLLSLFIVFFLASGFIYSVEHNLNPKLNSFGDGFYYAVVTLTTVGFGDITPVTDAGRMVTIIIILMGVVIIPWQAGQIIKEWFNLNNKKEIICPKCKSPYHDYDAIYCKTCGTKLFPD